MKQIHWERWSRFYLPRALPRGHPYLWSRARRNMIREELALVKQNGAWKPRRKGWSGLFYPPNGLNFQFCWFNLIFWLLRVDPSPILFYFYFFNSIRVGPSRSDPDWRSELIRSDFCTCLLACGSFAVFCLRWKLNFLWQKCHRQNLDMLISSFNWS